MRILVRLVRRPDGGTFHGGGLERIYRSGRALNDDNKFDNSGDYDARIHVAPREHEASNG